MEKSGSNFYSITNVITYISIVIIIGWAIYHGKKLRKAFKSNEKVNIEDFEYIPSFYNTLGILGTFTGIFIGLLFFKVKNITESIPNLLNGLKTAFVTSIVGIIISLYFSFNIRKLKNIIADNPSFKDENSIMAELLIEIKAMNQNQKSFMAELINSIKGDKDDSISTQIIKLKNSFHDDISNQFQILNKIQQSLGSDDDTSLLTNIIRLRDEQRESTKTISSNFNTVKDTLIESKDFIGKKFDEFGSILEKSNTEALVKVIENVIGGFNERLNELIERLVKENFEELNNSVKNLNEWQQKNKQQVEELISQFTKVSEQLGISSEKLEKISSYTQELVEGEGKLKKLIEELEQVLVKNTTLKESAENLLKSTENLHNSSVNLQNWAKEQDELIVSINNLVDDLKEIEQLRDKSGEFWNDIKKRMEEGIKIIEKGNADLLAKVNTIDDAFYERMNQSFRNLDKILQNVTAEYAERIKKLIVPDKLMR